MGHLKKTKVMHYINNVALYMMINYFLDITICWTLFYKFFGNLFECNWNLCEGFVFHLIFVWALWYILLYWYQSSYDSDQFIVLKEILYLDLIIIVMFITNNILLDIKAIIYTKNYFWKFTCLRPCFLRIHYLYTFGYFSVWFWRHW